MKLYMIAPIDIALIKSSGRTITVSLPTDFKAKKYDSHHMAEDKIKFVIDFIFCVRQYNLK